MPYASRDVATKETMADGQRMAAGTDSFLDASSSVTSTILAPLNFSFFLYVKLEEKVSQA